MVLLGTVPPGSFLLKTNLEKLVLKMIKKRRNSELIFIFGSVPGANSILKSELLLEVCFQTHAYPPS